MPRLLGGPHAEAFAAAESLVEQNRIEDALAAYRPLATKDDITAAVRRIVEGRIKTLENAVSIASHEWVNLQPEANLAGWRRVFGDWKVAADGTLVGAAGEDVRDRAIGARLLAPHRLVRVGARGVPGPVGQVPAAIKDKNEVRIVLWEGEVPVFVNGRKTVNTFGLPPEALADDALGIADSVRGESRSWCASARYGRGSSTRPRTTSDPRPAGRDRPHSPSGSSFSSGSSSTESMSSPA